MITQDRFALNRSVYPSLDVSGFLALASRLRIQKVELRNDLPGGILGGLTPQQLSAMAKRHRLRVITINALQNFNSAMRLPVLLGELKELLKVAVSIECEAIILCPTHSQSDSRSHEVVFQETVGALKAFRPYFEERGVWGYIEPIGLKDCSLRSLMEAMRAIQESRGTNYRIVYDTFHHFTGPDTAKQIEKEYDVSRTGLVHVSGVTSNASSDRYTDDLRVMLSPGDKIGNIEQIALLERRGYRGNISFEPFSPLVHELDLKGIETAIRQSVELIQHILIRAVNR